MQFTAITSTQRGLDGLIARDIARKILSGQLTPGALLPSEVELCEQLGVSRTALREALKQLTSKGLLESRPKTGTRVRQRSSWNMLDAQLLDWMSGMEGTLEMYHQFLEFRRVIEPHATRLAAENATAEQRIALSRLYEELCESARGLSPEQWADVDARFHRLIFQASGNCFYTPFGNLLVTVFKWFVSHSSRDGGMCLAEHRQIYKAIMMADGEMAYQASVALMNARKSHI